MLEPSDDVKAQVQANTISMKKIEDMLTVESLKTAEMNRNILNMKKIKDMLTEESLKTAEMNRNILKMIEDLRQEVKKISTDGHHRVKDFRAKTEKVPTSYII